MYEVFVGLTVGVSLAGLGVFTFDYIRVRRAAGAGAAAFNFIQQQIAAQQQQRPTTPPPPPVPAAPEDPNKPRLIRMKKEG